MTIKPKDLPFNPGEIMEVNGWPRWRTKVGPFELMLDIVPVGQSENGLLGIASFVVMEQQQPFLNYAGHSLAESIASQTGQNRILLITTETKGSHFAPWIWGNLSKIIQNNLEERVITLRKGEPKLYMRRPILIDGQEIELPQVSFHSITSKENQILQPSPKDIEYLFKSIREGVEPVFVDDFTGRGGTVVAVWKIFRKLNLKPPRLACIIGADGDLYKQTFAQERINVNLLPQPFLLRLPTFTRQNELELWRVNI